MAFPDDLQYELDRFMQEQNSHGLKEFEWYSPFEMQVILYHPFSSMSPVRLNYMEERDYRRVPLLNQARYILEHIRQAGSVKLTDKGFLPTNLVKEIYSQGIMKDDIIERYKKNKVLREFDSYSIHMTRLLLEVTGLTKKRKGKLSLTKKGERLHQDDPGLLFHLLHAFTFSFNPGYFDGYGQSNIGRLGWAFTIILLAKYGRLERPGIFYAEKHFNAFPAMLREANQPYIRDQQTTAYCCYSLRTFEYFLQHLGIIQMKFDSIFDDQRMITTTDLLWKLFTVDIPATVKGRN